LLAVAVSAWSPAAYAAVNPTVVSGLIDFEDQPVGAIAGNSLTIVSSGVPVTFSGVGLQIRTYGSAFPPTKGLSTLVDSEVITVEFGGELMQFVQFENIINGRYTAETDVVTGKAFDAANNLLDTETSAATIFRLDGPNIAKVVYDDDNMGGGYIIDNFEFATVPEPGLGSALILALIGIARRR
jgi:hypothetical protein